MSMTASKPVQFPCQSWPEYFPAVFLGHSTPSLPEAGAAPGSGQPAGQGRMASGRNRRGRGPGWACQHTGVLLSPRMAWRPMAGRPVNPARFNHRVLARRVPLTFLSSPLAAAARRPHKAGTAPGSGQPAGQGRMAGTRHSRDRERSNAPRSPMLTSFRKAEKSRNARLYVASRRGWGE